MIFSQVTLYQVLGVKQDASSKEIKAAYRKLSRHVHPDKTMSATSNSNLQAWVNNAYETLSDQGKRIKYDRDLRTQRRGNNCRYVNSIETELLRQLREVHQQLQPLQHREAQVPRQLNQTQQQVRQYEEMLPARQHHSSLSFQPSRGGDPPAKSQLNHHSPLSAKPSRGGDPPATSQLNHHSPLSAKPSRCGDPPAKSQLNHHSPLSAKSSNIPPRPKSKPVPSLSQGNISGRSKISPQQQRHSPLNAKPSRCGVPQTQNQLQAISALPAAATSQAPSPHLPAAAPAPRVVRRNAVPRASPPSTPQGTSSPSQAEPSVPTVEPSIPYEPVAHRTRSRTQSASLPTESPTTSPIHPASRQPNVNIPPPS